MTDRIDHAANTIEALVKERDELAAVIEKARETAQAVTSAVVNVRKIWEVKRILDPSPADALREVKAQAWDEGYGPDEECRTPRENPYRKERANG